MGGSVWICTLSVVLILIQRQFMTVSADDTCPRLEIPPGAILINPSCNNTYGSKCVFTCQNGFVMVAKEGNVTRTCLQSGNWSGNPIKCSERRKPTKGYRTSEKRSLSVEIGIGFSSILILLIIIAVVIVRFRVKRRSTECNAPTLRLDLGNGDVDDGAFDNPSYCRARSLLDIGCQLEVMTSPQPEQQTDGGFGNLHIDTGGRCPILTNTEKEVIPLDSSPYSSETLHDQLPSSFPKQITKVEATFSNAGGELSAPLESDIRIIVPSGAIPSGSNQNIFFSVFSEETILLRDIPETPDNNLISPVVECGPHDIHLSKPVEIIVPHCLCLSDAKMECITVYRCGVFLSQGRLNWERVPNEAEKSSQSQAVFTVKKDAIHIKTKTFSLWSIFACGGPKRKIARVFYNRPDPKSDLIYIRFYVYSENMDSKKRVDEVEKERFPDSKSSREKPFKMYKDNKVITVKLADVEEGWNFDKTGDTQIYKYEKARGSGYRCKDACDFAVKPEDGRDVNGFCCNVKFQQEGDDEEHSFYLNPGFTPLKRQSIRLSSAERGRNDTTSGTSQYDGSADWNHYISSLGNEPVSEFHIHEISPDVGRDWKDLLRSLTIKEKVIENLSEDYKNDKVTEQCIQGLIKWREHDPSVATMKTLAIALRKVGCFDALQTLRKLQSMDHQ